MPTKAQLKAEAIQAFHKQIYDSKEFQQWKFWRMKQEEDGKLTAPKLGYVHAYLTDIGKTAPLETLKWKKRVNVADLIHIDFPTVSEDMKEKIKPEVIPLEKISNIFKKKPKVKPLVPPMKPPKPKKVIIEAKPKPKPPPTPPAPSAPVPPVAVEISPSDEVLNLILKKYGIEPIEKKTSVKEIKAGKEFTEDELAMCKVLRIIDPKGGEIVYTDPTMGQIEALQNYASKGLISSAVCDKEYGQYTDCSKAKMKTVNKAVYFEVSGAKVPVSPKISEEVNEATPATSITEEKPPKEKKAKKKKCHVTYVGKIPEDEFKTNRPYVFYDSCKKVYARTNFLPIYINEPGEKTPVTSYVTGENVEKGIAIAGTFLSYTTKTYLNLNLPKGGKFLRTIKEFEGKCKFIAPAGIHNWGHSVVGYSTCDDEFYTTEHPIKTKTKYKLFAGKLWRYGSIKGKIVSQIEKKDLLKLHPEFEDELKQLMKPKKKAKITEEEAIEGLGELFG